MKNTTLGHFIKKANGHNCLEMECGCRLIGTFIEGNLHGKGKMINCPIHASISSIVKIQGMWDKGNVLMDKKFTLTYQNNAVYKGTVYNQLMERHGHGKMKQYKDGVCVASFTGEWQNNKMHGKGMVILSDGSSYSGDWIENAPNGHGRMVYKNGDVYVGQIRNSKRHGSGEMIYANGVIDSGEWRDNMFISKYAVDKYPTLYSVD